MQKWKKALDEGEDVCTKFMNLSKAFDTINYDLLLAKLKSYDVQLRKRSVTSSQINNNFSSNTKVQAGVPQGSTDGPLLFNQFINDIVLFSSEKFLSKYADDSNLHSIGKEMNIIKEKLRKDFMVVINWFFENYVTLNPTKCHYMCLGKNKQKDTFHFENKSLKNSKEEVILGLTIDNKLSFDENL